MGFTFIASGAIKFIAALKLAKQAFLLLSRAFLTNPIVLAIAAIITAAWMLYDNWDKVTAYLRERWEAI